MSTMTPTNQRAVELAPCPFCGGTEIHRGTDDFGFHQVFCADCGGCVEDAIPDKAIAAWNRRAPGWRPISEAPNVFIGYSEGDFGPEVYGVCVGPLGDFKLLADPEIEVSPTHWMPLPPPPGVG